MAFDSKEFDSKEDEARSQKGDSAAEQETTPSAHPFLTKPPRRPLINSRREDNKREPAAKSQTSQS